MMDDCRSDASAWLFLLLSYLSPKFPLSLSTLLKKLKHLGLAFNGRKGGNRLDFGVYTTRISHSVTRSGTTWYECFSRMLIQCIQPVPRGKETVCMAYSSYSQPHPRFRGCDVGDVTLRTGKIDVLFLVLFGPELLSTIVNTVRKLGPYLSHSGS